MLTRRFFLSGLVAAPAVIAADKLMPVRSIIKPYATVWGVGWDLEVVEHVVWTPNDALNFARFGTDEDGLSKFREVTEVIYTNPNPLPVLRMDHWTYRDVPENPMERFAAMQYGEWRMVQVPSLEHPHAVRYEPVTVFDDANAMSGKHPFIRKLNLKEHCGVRHTEHLAELAKEKDPAEIARFEAHLNDYQRNILPKIVARNEELVKALRAAHGA